MDFLRLFIKLQKQKEKDNFQLAEDLHFKFLHDTIHIRGGNPTPKSDCVRETSAKV